MAEFLAVTLDIERIRANLSRAERRDWTDEQVRAWLIKIGMVPRADEWVCEEITLSGIEDSEILGVRPLA